MGGEISLMFESMSNSSFDAMGNTRREKKKSHEWGGYIYSRPK